MASTRDIRRRIRSIENTSQITRAMQMVAASKMRRAQQAALAGRPYAQMLNGLMKQGRGNVNRDAHPLLQRREVKQVCVLLITTDKGLCGGLNTNLFRRLNTYDMETTSFVTVGRRGKAYIARTRRKLLADFEIHDRFTYGETRPIAKFLMDLYAEKKVDRVDVLLSQFINTLTQRPRLIQLLPLAHVPQVEEKGLGEIKTVKEEPPVPTGSAYEFEPNMTEVLNAIVPHIVSFGVWFFLLHGKASEHSARMVAMKNATDNANQLIKDLTLEYNKIRQAGITNELLEITTAQMALG